VAGVAVADERDRLGRVLGLRAEAAGAHVLLALGRVAVAVGQLLGEGGPGIHEVLEAHVAARAALRVARRRAEARRLGGDQRERAHRAARLGRRRGGGRARAGDAEQGKDQQGCGSKERAHGLSTPGHR
jgi:hypothetical protein